MGIGCELTEIKILNRVVCITSEGLEYEADPRHTELINGSLGLTTANAVITPGVKDPVPDYSITTSDDLPTTTMGKFGSTNAGVSACCAILSQRQKGILTKNHDNMDVDATSSPLCNHSNDMDMDLEHPDYDHQRDSNNMDVDHGLARKECDAHIPKLSTSNRTLKCMVTSMTASDARLMPPRRSL